MDNLCHTLTGAAFAEAGLKHRTRFGSAALMIAANLPDVDVLAFVTGTPPVAVRRGWTHGVIAQAMLPVLLTAIFVLIDRRWPDPMGARRVRAGAMLLLGAVGVFSHVALDWLNTYGVRLLMPLSRDWFYGDSVFIVDPWLWLMLFAGVMIARRLRAPRAAVAALAVATLYIGLMIASGRLAREVVVSAWISAKGAPPDRIMVGPVPFNPLRKTVIVDAGDHYERGTFGWWPRDIRFSPEQVPKNDRHPAAVHAAQSEAAFRGLLVWSRFPYYALEHADGGKVRVTVGDMRFSGRTLFTATTVVDR